MYINHYYIAIISLMKYLVHHQDHLLLTQVNYINLLAHRNVNLN